MNAPRFDSTMLKTKTIHPHPTLGESIGMAAEVGHGSCR
jgi:pyruvate/2-oxoglutarate dehydrogenase complex dihydrolipoamide dehydrogenase (E3) component